jgi:hypothetical protein
MSGPSILTNCEDCDRLTEVLLRPSGRFLCHACFAGSNGSTPDGTVIFRRPSELRAMGATEAATPVWGSFLTRAHSTLLSGKPKAGKTTLVEGIANAIVSDAGAFLGYPVAGGEVVVITEESRALALKRYPSERFSLLTREDAWPMPTWADLLKAAADRVIGTGAVLVVIDTLAHWASLRGDQEKDPSVMQGVMAAQAVILRVGAPCSTATTSARLAARRATPSAGPARSWATSICRWSTSASGPTTRRTTGAS